MNDDLKTVVIGVVAGGRRFALLLTAVAALAHAQGSLFIVDPTISGNTVTLPIHLEGNVLDGVAALDFQLSFDPAILEPVRVELGEAAASAGKEIQARLLADGQYVVLMFGLGRNSVAQGEVARIELNKLRDPIGGETPVTIGNTTFATVSGVEIPSQGSTTTLLFESDSGNGGGVAGGLPPIFGVGSPTGSGQASTTRNTGPPAAVTGTGKSDVESASGGLGTFDLAEARAAADARLSMLRGAQVEREAARAAVDRLPAGAGNNSEIKVRRASRPSAINTARRSGRPGERADLNAVENGSATRRTGSDSNENVQQERGVQPEPMVPEFVDRSVSTGDSGGMEPVDEVESATDSAFGRDIRLRAGFLAACLAVAVGIFFVRQRRGP